jgi:CRP/FNR family cyclic AMP-dependent transcriptional regulator
MSYEKEIAKKMAAGEIMHDQLEIPLLKYLWDAGPLSFMKKESYHDFFKNISVLSSFTDNEIRLFTKSLHRREFQTDEVIFKQGDTGYGFYFIFTGSVNIFSHQTTDTTELGELVVKLERCQYFGEMGLLEEFNRRTANAVAAENTILLGIFKPDLDKMLEIYPVMGAKFLRETTLIMANRMGQLTKEIVLLRKKIKELEKNI